MYRILVIEDDMTMAKAIKKQLESWGNDVRLTEDFRNILSVFTEYDPHMVLMDIMLPFFNGYHWCSKIRKISNVPVVFIYSASDNMNIVMAMNMGGDDFICKPVDPNVMMAKIQAVLRRTYDMAGKIPMLEHRGAILNLHDTSLSYEGKRLELTRNEFRILQTLLENKGKVVSRDQIMTALWETDSFVDDNTLTVNITRLRKKLAAAGLNGFILTKKGLGYYIPESDPEE